MWRLRSFDSISDSFFSVLLRSWILLGESLLSFPSAAILLLLNLCLSNQGLGDLSVLHYKSHRLPQWLSSKQSTCSEELQATRVWSLGRKDPLEEDMATHSSILAWRIPWTEEPSRLLVYNISESPTWLKPLSTHAHIISFTVFIFMSRIS